ncbi:hypothetical protein B0H14DRAFT_3138700 [Mycena olivaceomarginata]|nr:hypothetical protein B0H14DRAFT_3138700 [Mycena olivaceomarginata]
MERVVFPPVEPVPAAHGQYAEEMGVDIDIEGEDAPRLRASSSWSFPASRSPPRLGSPPPLPAPHTSTFHPAASTSTRPPRPYTRRGLPLPHPPRRPRSSQSVSRARACRCLAPMHRSPTRTGARSSARRAAERVRGSGGWDMVEAREGYVYGYVGGYMEDGFGFGYAGAGGSAGTGYFGSGTSAYAGAGTSSSADAYEVVEFAGGWNVVPDGGVRGPETDEDVDIVGDADVDHTARARKRKIVYGATPGSARVGGSMPESICLPKMQKRWKDAGGVTLVQTPSPPRVDKGKGKARAQPEEAMDLDLDVVAIDAACAVPAAEVVARPTSTAAALSFPTRTAAGGTVFGAVAQYEFRALEPHVATFRCRWPTSSLVFRRRWSECGGRRSQQTPESESRNQPAQKAVSAAVKVLPSADTVASASTLAEAQMLPPADVYPSSRIRFVEPVTGVLHRDAHGESLGDDREHDDDALLLAVGEEEPYRAPAPRRSRRSLMSSSTSHRVFSPTRRLCPTEREGGIADNGAAALACVGYHRIALVRPSRAGSASARPIAAAHGHPGTSSRGQDVVPGVTGASEAGARGGGRGGAGARAREPEGTGARAGTTTGARRARTRRMRSSPWGRRPPSSSAPSSRSARGVRYRGAREGGGGRGHPGASHARDVLLLFGPVLEVGAGHTP